jgi:hypothetical protein
MQRFPMTNDYLSLKDIFEYAELLEFEGDDCLEIQTVDERTDKTARVIFNFNEFGELEEVLVQE